MPGIEVLDLDWKMVNRSLINIDCLLENEENPDIAILLQVAKDALTAVNERKWPLGQEQGSVVHKKALCMEGAN